MNKSFLTNAIALCLACFSYLQGYEILFTMSIFALSGALTNWLAVHMLFEKVPGLYGSGVIPTHFEAFKLSIHRLIMTQFFSQENIERLLNQQTLLSQQPDLIPIIETLDLTPAFETLVKTIMESSFGSMLAMMGGEEALKPLQQPFSDNMRRAIIDMTSNEAFSRQLLNQFGSAATLTDLKQTIDDMINKRLDELTPQMVKAIIQAMIRQHLGWLVVWGGFFGAFIGLISAMLNIF